MPEHDTFDLDAAFAALEQDLAGITSPRGAGAAIATARRRRRTTVGAIAAGAVLVVGAAAVGQGIASRDTSVGPAELPPPSPFDASALTAATQGWAADWHSPATPGEVSFQGPDAPRCLAAMADDFDTPGTPGPVAGGGGLLVSQGGEASMTTLAQWGADRPDASIVGYGAVIASVDGCAHATADREFTWDGGQGRSWTITVGGQKTQHMWVVRTDRALGVLWTGGSAGPVPDDVDQQVASALVAGLQSSKSFQQIPTSTSTSEASTSAASPVTTGLSFVASADFARAVSGWDNAWRQGGAPRADLQVPCPDGWGDATPGVNGASLGANGDQEFGQFSSADAARAAVGILRQSLGSCAGSSYQVSTPPGADPETALVAAGPDIVWVGRHASTVGVIVIPGGSSAPPARVTSDVIALMVEASPTETSGN
jgi:hypothetical protein